MAPKLKIAVVGLGIVGVPTAALLAAVPDHTVVAIQRRSLRSGWKIDAINKGQSPIGGYEPGLNRLISDVIEQGSLRATDEFKECSDASAILVAVQTATKEEGIPDYGPLESACRQIGHHLAAGTLVVCESTVSPGTTEHLIKPILEKESGLIAGKDFSLAFSYERVMLGRLLYNIRNYPKIVGGFDEESTQRAVELYRTIVVEAEIVATDILTAEIGKTVENAYRDVNIAFANEIALICENLGVDVYRVRELVNNLPFNSNAYRTMHLPGPGVGGHCLPKDSLLLRYGSDNYGKKKIEPRLLLISRQVNDSMPNHMAMLMDLGLRRAGRDLSGSRVGILGLAFLENSDDPRNSPAIPLARELIEKGVDVTIHDPFIHDLDGLKISKDMMTVVSGADGLALVTSHDAYRELNFQCIRPVMRTPVFVDGRNFFDGRKIEGFGFIYVGIGKGQFLRDF